MLEGIFRLTMPYWWLNETTEQGRNYGNNDGYKKEGRTKGNAERQLYRCFHSLERIEDVLFTTLNVDK